MTTSRDHIIRYVVTGLFLAALVLIVKQTYERAVLWRYIHTSRQNGLHVTTQQGSYLPAALRQQLPLQFVAWFDTNPTKVDFFVEPELPYTRIETVVRVLPFIDSFPLKNGVTHTVLSGSVEQSEIPAVFFHLTKWPHNRITIVSDGCLQNVPREEFERVISILFSIEQAQINERYGQNLKEYVDLLWQELGTIAEKRKDPLSM